MVDELQPDFLQIDEETGVPFPKISIEFGEEGTGSLRSSPVGSGIEPPPPESFEGDETFMRGVSSFYNFLTPSDEAMADLKAVQQRNQEIADQTGMPLKRLQQIMAYGDERSKILKDMGFKLYTPGQDFTRVRDFLYGAQKKAFEKRESGVSHSELPLDEKIATFMLPIDVLDFIGLGVGVKALIKAGIKKFAGNASKKSVVDLVQDQELISTLSDAETISLFEDVKPLLPGEERDAFVRNMTGQPPKIKTSGTLTAKDEILGLGDDLRAPKQIQDAPTVKEKPSPTKSKEVEKPVTIDDIIATTQADLVGKKAFAGKRPGDIIGKAEEPKDPFLTPDEPISEPMTKIEEIKAKKESKTTAAKDPVVIELQQKVPKFLDLSDPEKRLVASKFMNIMFSPAKKKALFETLSNKQIINLNNYIKRNNLATPEMLDLSTKISKEFSPSFSKEKLASDDDIITMFENIENWKNSPDGKIDKTGYSLSGETLREVMSGGDKKLYDLLIPNVRSNIITSLKDDLNKLGLTDIASIGDKIKIPQSKSARELLVEMDRLTFPEGYNFITSGLVDASQKLDYNQATKKIVQSLQDKGDGYLSNAAASFMEQTLNRMLNQAVRKDIPLDDIFKKVRSIDADGIADILARRQKYNNKIQDFLTAGYDVDFAEIGHIKAIGEDALLALDIDNLALQSAKANGAEFRLRNKIKNILKDPDNPNAPEEIDEVIKELTDLGISTKVGDTLYGTARSIEDDLRSLEIGASDAIFGTYSKGGMVEDDLNIFEPIENNLPEGSFEVASLKLPFFKLFGKAPVNEVAPIPTPKENLKNPTKKQTQSLETEKAKRAEEDIFDPTPGEPVQPESQVAMTPLTNQPMTSVFYSDIERALVNAPDEFPNKQAVLDFMNKNRIKKSEVEDYRIPSLLKLYDEGVPITKQEILSQIRSAPISGLRVHGTGMGSKIINPNGDVATRYTGYAEPGFIDGTQRERVLYLNKNKLPGDTGEYPQSMFGGENIQRHDFGIPNEDNTYIVGWTRLTDRFGFIPPKVAGPETKINLRQINKEINKNERSLKGLYAEAQTKIGRLANQRGMDAADLNDILADFGSTDNVQMSVINKYANQLNEVSPGLVDQMDELIVRNNELQAQVTKATAVDPSGVVRVTFADEIQSDLLQAAAGRKQQLAAALRKIQEEGAGETNLQGLNRLAEQTINFYEKNKSVFRPLKKTDTEIKTIADRVAKLDEEVDEIVNKYIQTREVSDADLSRLSGLLNENLDNMLKEIIEIDSSAMDGLFPDLPFKNRDEWADALIKKDLYELAYRKFVLKEADASDYYAVSPSDYVIERYKGSGNFEGNAATPKDVRDLEKASRIETFKREGRFVDSKYKGIGMDEFYGGPNSVDEKGKHYTSTLEKILKKQAQSNNSEIITMPVQVKSGEGSAYFKITDQNDNMVATLTNGDQARELLITNPNYKVETITVPNKASMEPVFAIKITPEMLEPYKTHKAQGGLVEHIDIFEV